MSQLKDVLKPKKSTNKSSKNPAYYNAEKNRCIVEGATSKEPSVRRFFATNSHTPTKVLTAMLKTEQDKQILRTILINEKMPRKVVAEFISNKDDRRVDWFNDDAELIAHFTQE